MEEKSQCTQILSSGDSSVLLIFVIYLETVQYPAIYPRPAISRWLSMCWSW